MISWWWPSLVWPRGFRRVGKLVFSNPSKISPDISWLYSMIPTPDQHFTSSAFFQTRCNSFVLSLQPSIIAESKIIHFSIHGDFTLVRWIFHLNNGGWIGRDEFFKRGFRICEFSNCDGNGEANNNVSSKGNVFVLFGAQSIGVE